MISPLNSRNVLTPLQAAADSSAEGDAQPQSAAALPVPGEAAGLPSLPSGYGLSSVMDMVRSSMALAKDSLRSGGKGAADVAAPAVKNAAGAGGSPTIVQIDDFTTDGSGFNHGKEMADTMKKNDPNVNLQQMDVSGGNKAQKITQSLRSTLQRVQNGEKIDAVHLPMSFSKEDANTAEARQLIEQLTQAGVPVAVAAGNDGPGQTNKLMGQNSFNVQSGSNGQVSANSGKGNVTADGRTTSFASANLVTQLAAMKSQGMSLDQIRGAV